MAEKQTLINRITEEQKKITVRKCWIKGRPEEKIVNEYLKGLEYALNLLNYNNIEACVNLLAKEYVDTYDFVEAHPNEKHKRGKCSGLYFAYQLFKGENPSSLAG